jgi:hypothetical protein
MKCPHCGMIIRENITECGYCGGKITPRPDRSAGGSSAPTGMVQGKAALTKGLPVEADGDEEEEGGLSRVLMPGEQVLIGALNVTVKKFFFHAYLTDQRIFLIDTQEKKIRVTAKDIPRNTIAGCIVEFSETSDPVLVLSLRSGDDELKTMKLVFVQNGMDRSAEIDEWISLLQEDRPSRKAPGRPPARKEEPRPEPEEEAEPDLPAPEPPVVRRPQELRPGRKPTKELEKQPPVKRLLSMYKVEEDVPEPSAEPEEQQVPVPPPARKARIRQVQETPARAQPVYDREIPPFDEEREEPVKKPEVQSAMKVAMKSAMRPLQQQHVKPVRRTIAAEPMGEPAAAVPPRRPVVQEPSKEKRVHEDEVTMATPQFCHNCGKKLPPAANFCPGCGTKLSQSRTLPRKGHTSTTTTDRRARTDPPHEQPQPPRPPARYDDEDEDEGGEMPVPAKPPVKKAPKGSEMTILHKFLRR